MFYKKKPWPFFKVEISACSNSNKIETIKIQAKNEGMAGFLAMRKSILLKETGAIKVDNVKVCS